MIGLIATLLRGSNKPGGTQGGQTRPTVATAAANSSAIAIHRFAWGAIRFSVDPGTVTVYTRCDPEDDWTIARTKNGAGDITFSPGATQAYPLPDDMFYYNEVKLVASNDITGTAGACRMSLKS